MEEPYTLRVSGGDATQPPERQPAGKAVVSVTPDGFRVGRREFRGTSLELVTDRTPAIWVDDHLYRGKLRFVRQVRKMVVVNLVPLEDYVASVVDGEMPATFPEAARQAQAIAARTYVLFQMGTARVSPLYDVYATTRSQNYLGYQYRGRDGRRYAAESASSRRAADDTAAMVCLCEGKLFCTYYTAVCGGRTTAASAVFDDPTPALASVPCDGCQEAELYHWTRTIPLSDASDAVRRYFAARGKRLDGLVSIRRTRARSIGQPQNVHEPVFELSDGKRRLKLSAMELRRIFPSAISSFEFEPHVETGRGRLILDGRGHGHGVGLCQWGARGMAQAGAGPLEILAHYYPRSEVVAIGASREDER